MAVTIYDEKQFLRDGKPHLILSGVMHYFRVPREYWYDRMLKLKECGFNTLETYTCWNLHEKKEGEFDFTGGLDVAAYIRMAGELGLDVILRPGPYICSEWDAGGIPAWILTYEKMPIRCNHPDYLAKCRNYLEKLFAEVRPLLASNGGPIQMMQIENEYGSFGNDHDYLRALAGIFRDCGVDCPLFTADGPFDWSLNGGSLPEYLSIGNFGSRVKEQFADLKKYCPYGPTMCGEFWGGWFDHWYETHHTRDVDDMISCFREMLEMGASVNYYAFHGGTNYGFMSGANYFGTYEPTTTSYDFYALLNEAGDRTPAYYAVRDLIREFTGTDIPLTATDSKKAAYGEVQMDQSAALLDVVPQLGETVRMPVPVFQEELGQSHGFTLYSCDIHGPYTDAPLLFEVLHDRASVYFDGKLVGIIERDRRNPEIMVTVGMGEKIHVDILVENMGRINYGPQMADRKGAVGIRLGLQYIFGWDITPLTMPQFTMPNNLTDLTYENTADMTFTGTRFLKGKINIDEPADTFLRLDGFHRGCVWVNGFHLGRYYNDAGPQMTLYCPAPRLKAGENEIIVLECDGAENGVVRSVDAPDFG